MADLFFILVDESAIDVTITGIESGSDGSADFAWVEWREWKRR